MVSKRGWELGLVGGVLGLVALALPWIVITVSALGMYASVGISPLQILQGIQNSSSGSGASSIPPDILAQLEQAVGLLILGVVIYGIGCIVALVRPHGGFVMLLGAIIGTVGAASFGTYSVVLASLSVGPGIGEALAVLASIIAMVGVFLKEPDKYAAPQAVAPTYPSPLGVVAPTATPAAPPEGYGTVGSHVVAACPSCGRQVSPKSEYCANCGAKLSWA